ncbi:c-type cytochrome [Croceitalea sp. P059]|uniref:c-type cytochrome n=1 Tax=Croceitalea sp. P059 TaxID=3075601 RepID=UPI002884FB2C|nr:c-type cytochrome [Croceitalea sp. P059]MDT0539750.1 c-type cytochrome [Croceitalea sp. P059]
MNHQPTFDQSLKKLLKLVFALVNLVFIVSCESKEEPKPFLTGLGMGIEKTTLQVDNIEEAITFYRDSLGFSIRGEASEGNFEGSLTMAIGMGDMTTFELLAKNDTLIADSIAPILRNQTPNGIRFFALSSSSVDSTFAGLSSVGMQLDSTKEYRRSSAPAEGWSRDTGESQRKSLDFDAEAPPAYLPRFIERIGSSYVKAREDWKSYYIFTRMYGTHPNGVVGTSAIKVAVHHLDSIAMQYNTMGFEILEATDSIVRYSIFKNQELHLVSAEQDKGAKNYLANRTDGVYALEFDVADIDSTYQYFKTELPETAYSKTADRLTINSEHAFGVQLEFVQEPESQAVFAKTYSFMGEMDTLAVNHAASLYSKYCALCHGDDRQGYTADHAPSLRSKSLLGTSMNTNFLRYTVQFGRANTAMGGYLDKQGGPMEYIEIELLLAYLNKMAEVESPIELSREPIAGDITKGAGLYEAKCAVCHGNKGEGITAPALANPMLLATATDDFLRYAIAEGRDGTPMLAFKDSLSDKDINNVTAFLRSRASGWDKPQELDSIKVPEPEEYVLNPDSIAPVFKLRENKFVAAEQVNKAFTEGKRMIILDARSEVAWRQMHIPGAAPVPYYSEPDEFIDDIPNDGTQIVIYCACPHAASERVLATLRRYGYKNTAIIDEGILVWAQMGFPVRSGS